MTAKATSPEIVDPAVHDFRVSFTVKFEKRDTTQNAESFGNERQFPPAHIAKATNMGETVLLMINGPNIVDAIINATVDDPCAALSNTLNKKPVTRIDIFQEDKVSTR
jgi:hypothetical protein